VGRAREHRDDIVGDLSVPSTSTWSRRPARVVDHPLGRAETDALVCALVTEQAHAPVRVDFRVITRAVAATPPEMPPMELYVRLDPGAQRDAQLAAGKR
jgi:hypothetical protein